MRVAVTGADGFIGSHLTELLVRSGHEVRAFVQYTSSGTWGLLEDLPSEIRTELDVHRGDVRDPATTDRLVRGAELVYHLAALVAVPYSYEAPRSYLDTNAGGTMNVLEAVRAHGARMVHTSTSEVYGSAVTVPISEAHPLQAQSPYAASKIAADKLAEAYGASYGVAVTTLRPFNTFGPRQSARAFIPAVMAQLMARPGVLLLGSLEPLRDLLFVEDTVRAFQALGEAPAEDVQGGVFNAGTGTAISMGDLARLICELFDRPDLPVEVDPERVRPAASEVTHLQCDSTRLRALTGWAPRTGLREGLARTRAWLENSDVLGDTDPAVYQR